MFELIISHSSIVVESISLDGRSVDNAHVSGELRLNGGTEEGSNGGLFVSGVLRRKREDAVSDGIEEVLGKHGFGI